MVQPLGNVNALRAKFRIAAARRLRNIYCKAIEYKDTHAQERMNGCACPD
jgi:hypothetical protein